MKKISFLLYLQFIFLPALPQLAVDHLLCENRDNPIAIDAAKPRFSWQLSSSKRNTVQTAFEIQVTADHKTIWSSGRINSPQSVQVNYAGDGLISEKQYEWKVRVWDNHGNASAWSQTATFRMGILNESDWKAHWIQPGYKEDPLHASPLFRKEFIANKKVSSAIVYITAHGLYEGRINGHRIGDAYLTPGWTSYHKRLQYQAYDITALIQQGTNALGLTLGSGWYRGTIGYTNSTNVYGNDIALLLQLKIIYTDGSSKTILSDPSWKCATGSILYSDIYNGEIIDAAKEPVGWTSPGFNDASWKPVKTADFEKNNLLATQNEPVRKHEIFKSLRIITTPAGEKVIDFGQNLVGWVMMRVNGKRGDTVTLSHAEVLDKKGNFYTENLRKARATDIYILKGGEEESFEPHFTWQGFRYVRINGYPGAINPDNFTAVALYSDMPPTGDFTCSNPMINQLQHNIQWGQKGNFLDIPTDCPQRDERLGWTGDAQVFSRTASFNMNVNNFFAKWLKDVAADQENGVVPHVIPNVLGTAISSAGWADAATIIPWNMYLAYGDRTILEDQYPSMKSYVESIRRVAKDDLWNTGDHYGDWLFYRPDDDNDGLAAVTDKYLIAQCFYANSTQMLINAAKVLGKTEDAEFYTNLLKKIKEAFVKEYMTATGRLVSGTQTAYVLALQFDMLPDSLRPQAANRLVKNIQSYDSHLTTGFLGTPYLCHVLTRFGYTDVAYKLLLQETYPSWLYPVKMGATTIWERWDGEKPDSSFQTPGMNSFNHYSYGAIGDWMYRQLVGLDDYEDGVGYQHIRVKPHIGGNLSFAYASLQTYYGKLSSGWKIQKGSGGKTQLTMDIQIPANTNCTVFIPASDKDQITESGKKISSVEEIKISGKEEGYIILNIGSGLYHFVVN